MISTRGRYALRVMIDLAENRELTENRNPAENERKDADCKYIPLKDIAMRQEISKKYLEIIVRDLVAGGLIVGASGKGGGYRLSRNPEDYTVGEIVEMMEGSLSTVACLADPNYNCPRRDRCKTLPMWQEYNALVRNYFYGKRLSDLLKP
ncbi:RrF2 family transcriptional regulator [Succinimonas sp.]|uniref:RrF2 family transcriptional regulator n=1 Tax=Succinimonas sp. TaxID=1936151 RepID=UPI00386AB975